MSERLPMLKARDIARVLVKLGFENIRQRGSHAFYSHADGRTTLVSVHGNEDIGRGLLRQILREIRISPRELKDLL